MADIRVFLDRLFLKRDVNAEQQVMDVRQVSNTGTLLQNPANPTYNVSYSGLVVAATPTDIFCIRGSATKKVVIEQMGIRIASTAVARMDFYWMKRTALNTGGTLSNPTPTKFDSVDPAATAQVDLYTANPATLGAGTQISHQQAATTAIASAVYAPVLLTNAISPLSAFAPTAQFLGKPIILNGVNESLCLNLNGQALPAGFGAIEAEVTWYEA